MSEKFNGNWQKWKKKLVGSIPTIFMFVLGLVIVGVISNCIINVSQTVTIPTKYGDEEVTLTTIIVIIFLFTLLKTEYFTREGYNTLKSKNYKSIFEKSKNEKIAKVVSVIKTACTIFLYNTLVADIVYVIWDDIIRNLFNVAMPENDMILLVIVEFIGLAINVLLGHLKLKIKKRSEEKSHEPYDFNHA